MENLSADGTDRFVGVRPDVEVFHLASLVRESNQECQVLSTVSSEIKSHDTHQINIAAKSLNCFLNQRNKKELKLTFLKEE